MKTYKTKLIKFITLSSLIFSAIYIVLCAAYNLILSDIVYSASVLPIAVELLVALCDLCAYGVCFSILIYSIYRSGVKSSMPILLIYSGVLLIENLLNITLEHVIFGTGWQIDGLIYVLIIWLFEVLLALAVLLIARFSLKNKKDKDITFNKLYSKENPLQLAALIVALLISAIKVISRLIFDIGYGAPADIVDLLWMLAAYSSDIISGGIVYIVSIFAAKKLYNKDSQ